MLPLLPSVLFNKIVSFFRISNRQFFFQRIVFLTLLGHIVLFGSMFLCSMIAKKEDKFTILMHQAGATYVLMPLQKKIEQKNMGGRHKNSSISKKSQVLNYEDYLQKKGSGKGKKNFVNNSKTSSVSLKKNQKTYKKLALKSKASAVVACCNTKNKHKKNKQQKKNKIKLISQKQEQEIQAEVKQPKIDSELIEKALLQEQRVDEKQSNEILQLQSEEALLEEVIFVGYEQFDACVISSKIQHAVSQNWTPPIGIEDTTSCELKIKVSMQGLADKIEIMKSSGILVYDISAKTALSQIEFPQEVYGKTIRIVLGN